MPTLDTIVVEVIVRGPQGPQVPDGDKGDITVSSNGSVWTIDNAVVGNIDTRAAITTTNIKAAQNYLRTAGYSTVGDGGGGLYKRVVSQPSHPGKVQSADGAWWELVEDSPNFLQFGAAGNGTTDDRQAIVDCIEYASEVGGAGTGKEIAVLERTFGVGSTITVPNNNNGVSQLVFKGRGRYTSFIKALSSFSGTTLFDIQGVVDFSHIGFNGNSQTISCFINNHATSAQIPTRIHHNNFVSFAGTSGVYRNNTNGVYEFYRNTVGTCVTAIYNCDWGTGSRIQDNDMLTSGTCVILDNQGASNEGIYIQNNFIGSTGSHGIQLNRGLDIYIQNNSITPINYAGGFSGIIVTGSVGPVRIESNWIEGFKCEVGCYEISLNDNYVPAGLGFLFNSPVAGALFNCRIISNTFAGAGAAARVSLTNCANFIVADNISAGPFFETGGTLELLFRGNYLGGTSSLSSACTLIDNKGGLGYTNDLDTSATGTTVNGTLTVSGATTTPTLIGGTAAAASLTLSPTSGVGAGSEFVRVVYGSNGASEAGRWDGAGRYLHGYTATVGLGTTSATIPAVQIHGTSANTGISAYRWANSSGGPLLWFFKSRGTTPGSRGIVSDGDALGSLTFSGDDGTNAPTGATIRAVVDGTPGAGDMPGRVEFMTTSDGASAATVRWSVRATGNLEPFADNTYDIGTTALRVRNTYSTQVRPGAGAVIWTSGAGTPEGSVTAPVGSLYTRTDGGAATTLYVKETGAGNTGWVGK